MARTGAQRQADFQQRRKTEREQLRRELAAALERIKELETGQTRCLVHGVTLACPRCYQENAWE